MDIDYTFKTAKNNLSRTSIIKALKAENDLYVATFFYEGDYDKDKTLGALSKDHIVVSIEQKETALNLKNIEILPNLKYIWGIFSLDFNNMDSSISVDKIDKTIEGIILAKESLLELINYFDEYFPNCR